MVLIAAPTSMQAVEVLVEAEPASTATVVEAAAAVASVEDVEDAVASVEVVEDEPLLVVAYIFQCIAHTTKVSYLFLYFLGVIFNI